MSRHARSACPQLVANPEVQQRLYHPLPKMKAGVYAALEELLFEICLVLFPQ